MILQTNKWICFAIGYVFIISGIAKLVISDFRVIFSNLGFPYPELILFIVAIIEITCGTLIAARIYLKQAIPALIVIMLGAILLTKLPILSSGDFLSFAFEARLDFVMLILLLMSWKYK
ncbi:DoxX family protein [Oceanobacillus halophilus]|uniref:DoxX family membrane protein n=1 Tax=Oceanobacillus halophilus TaxID=930130 RepID=A0A495A3T4_9BACI|nr:DoxX family membrane protein [Oceanobacillus halophilus]RKQ32940.1 DoxX family membrane protein [Oceanobacillus halophilus]